MNQVVKKNQANNEESGDMPTINHEVVTPMVLLNTAINQGKDISELSQLFDLQQRWEASEAKKAFTAAMARFKSNPPKILKDTRVSYRKKTGEVVEYDHASLASVCNAIVSGLGEVGISHSWDTEQSNGLITVSCVLTHESGYSPKPTTLSSMPDASGGKNSIQAIASTVSYLERYTVLASTGLAVQGMDDDGQGSEFKAEEPVKSPDVNFYSEDDFVRNFLVWRDLIRRGDKTAKQVISSLNKKGVNLTDGQIKRIEQAGEK